MLYLYYLYTGIYFLGFFLDNLCRPPEINFEKCECHFLEVLSDPEIPVLCHMMDPGKHF
jgi:hypothetical protein